MWFHKPSVWAWLKVQSVPQFLFVPTQIGTVFVPPESYPKM